MKRGRSGRSQRPWSSRVDDALVEVLRVGSPFVERSLVPVMRLWRHTRRSALTHGLIPGNTQSVYAAGSDSDRVLLFGAGVAVGLGTLTHDMALGGHLARALSARTGRGTDVDIVANLSMTVDDAPACLDSIPLERYDAVIVTLGASEAFGFASVGHWRRHLKGLLDQLHTAFAVDVVIAGIPSLRSIRGYGSLLGGMAENHALRYDRVSAELADGNARASFVPLSPAVAGPDGHGRAIENYRTWGAEIASATAPGLNAARGSDTPVVHDAAKSELERQASVDRLAILHTPPEGRFDRIVDQARVELGASAAALGFMDGDLVWYKSVIGATLPEIPFAASFTRAALPERGIVVVPDARADDRFKNLVHVQGEPWIRFWAGFPIEDDHGVRVGTLSVFDPEPRVPVPDRDSAVLRQLAQAIQDELRRPRP